MKKFFRNIIIWIVLKYQSIMINLSIALYNTENEILRADPNNLKEKDKRNQKILHRIAFLNRFYAGQRDEIYNRSYYEILKRADKFIRTATPMKYATTADKYSMSYGMKDQYGRRYEHYGFFDDKHKHAGKTVGEVLQLEMEERRLKDDNLPIIYMFNNAPIEEGIVKTFDNDLKETESGYVGLNAYEKSKTKKFPMIINRNNQEIKNKIEQLTDFLHVKRIDNEYRYFEFYIPKKYKLDSISKDSVIFKELINFDEIWERNQYGELIAFRVEKFEKYIDVDDQYGVLKFFGAEMK